MGSKRSRFSHRKATDRMSTRWIKILQLACLTTMAVQSSSCSGSNNLFLGQVEATAGSHTVVVTDCYRFTVAPPQKIDDAVGGHSGYRFAPCRDADVLIRDSELIVNGKSYGPLQPDDDVLVDHGVVSVNARGSEPGGRK